MRQTVVRYAQPSSDDGSVANIHKLATWGMDCRETEIILQHVATLCGRDLDLQPAQYQTLPSDAPALLSAICAALEHHLESQSSRMTNAIFAYLLTQTSEEYFEHVCRSVGYRWHGSTSTGNFRPPAFDVEEPRNEHNTSELDQHRSFPCFFSPELSQSLVRARQSLELLRVAQPSHRALSDVDSRRRIRWLWNEADVARAWQSGSPLSPLVSDTLKPPSITPQESLEEKDGGLDVFRLFDQEPGTHLGSLDRATGFAVDPGFEAFLTSFPPNLPSLTPSMSHLSELVLNPLADHASSLSTALVHVFLSPEGYFNFHAHMTLLRSYMLLTSHVFKSRLQSALFCDAFDTDEAKLDIKTIATSGTRPPSKDSNRVIGLAPGLTEGDWPPAGADLRYQLRTVIIDSLDIEYPDRQLSQQAATTDDNQKTLIYEEAEWRLGFAVRDLPTGSGHAKWLNPRYPPFPTFTSSQRIFVHFRFLASSFVSTLTSYVYDTAIGENFDAFLKKLSGNAVERDDAFLDAFHMADYHSRVMDDILSACLLRSSQKAAGDILRGALDIILEFGILISDRHSGRLEEYQTVEPLEELFKRFMKTLRALIKVLRTIVDKGSMTSHIPLEDALLHFTTDSSILPQLVGVTAKLHNLLTRLDVPMWWSRQPQS
ncbi:hypothetical protein EIP86_004917 [Pleurotus ostreatoroseus]|nr:hypothetical protein EIP86_004917 [Pleurotus ostreatoroseus]